MGHNEKITATNFVEKAIDNLEQIRLLKGISQDSLARAIGKERSVVTKKLRLQIPTSMQEFCIMAQHVGADVPSLILAQTNEELRVIVRVGHLDISNPEQEVTRLLGFLQTGYSEELSDGDSEILTYLIAQILQLFQKK